MTTLQSLALALSCLTVAALLACVAYVIRRMSRDLDGLKPEEWE